MDEKIVDEILVKLIFKVLKQAGFDNITTKALELYKECFKDIFDNNIKIIAGSIMHSGRVTLNMYDFVKVNTKIIPINFNILNIPNIDLNLQYEEYKDIKEWNSPLANKSEKFIHIYDFMPEFPATHTYRNTPLPETRNYIESINIKNRIEQSIKSEKNMFRLFKTSGSLPPFINYIYKIMKENSK